MTSRKKTLPTPLIVVLALTLATLVGIYIGGVSYYKKHYFPNTFIGGTSYANQSADYVVEKNKQYADDYLLSVFDRNEDKYHVAGLNINYRYVETGEEQALIDRQNAFIWPIEAFQTHALLLNRSFIYDEALLMEQVRSLELFSEEKIIPPQNARLDITEEGYEIIPEENGVSPIEEKVYEEIKNALDIQSTIVTLSDDCYLKPEIFSTDSIIADTAAKLNAYMNATIHYEIDGVDENLTSGKILSMLDITEDGIITVNEEKVKRYVQHLASTYNTYGDVRNFLTSQGDIIQIGGGDYGWVVNKTKEAEQILQDLALGTPVSREPVYEQRAVKSGFDDIGSTYIEIDYTNQHLWYYKAGNLFYETDIVSGSIGNGNGSPDGLFKIVYRQKDATLVGEDYASSVKYFMPFAYNVGIHDASWRGSFGNEIYKRNGSHGCINVPLEAAKTIFDAVDLGTPVIAYYREPMILSSENARISNAFSYQKPETTEEE